MTPANTSGLAAQRLQARRQRVRDIRRWVVTLAVVLFIAVATMIGTHTTWSTASPQISSSGSASGATTRASGSSSASSNSPAFGSGVVSPVTTSQS